MKDVFFILLVITVSCNKISFMSFGDDGKEEKEQQESKTEVFAPAVASEDLLDILLVIDNSHSMKEEQSELANKLDALLTNISASNWQIAVVTTDQRDCIRKVINKDTANYNDIFKSIINGLGTQGTHHEQATRMAIMGLQGDCQKKSWLRDKSTVSILIVTDEDNFEEGVCGSISSTGFIAEPLPAKECGVAALHDYLSKIRIPKVTARVYGLINPEKSEKFLAWKDTQGRPIFDHYASVHDKDYTATLKEISQNIHSALQNKFTLQKIHSNKNSTVIVKHANGSTKLLPDQYEISGNVLVIKIDLPPETTDVKVTYSYK